jgi:phosphate transport system permease protein
LRDRIGDGLLRAVCIAAALVAMFVLFEIVYQVVSGASQSISKFGVGFLTGQTWRPDTDVYGAEVLIYGTFVTSAMALLLAAPIGIAIGLFLSLLAPGRISALIGPLVEMLAAVPSVIVGLWGLAVLAPVVHDTVAPFLHDTLGFLQIFGEPQTTGLSLFTAGLVLAIMILPIIAALSRDLFRAVPRDMQDGATALGATRWEVIRGVVLPSAASGVASACFLGLGRALGEAIAVTQVVGTGNTINTNLFATGDTLASRIAETFPGISALHTASIFYLATILLVISLITNLTAQWIGRRFASNVAPA